MENNELKGTNLQTLLRGCKMCGELKVKTKIAGKKLFADENGKMWSGKVCPTCHIKDINKRNKVRRREKKAKPAE
jgi:hypothetical protein